MGRFDTSIYSNPLRSVADYESELDKRDLSRQNLMLNKLKMDEYQRGIQEQNALRGVYGSLGADPQANYQTLLNKAGPEAANKYMKGIADTEEQRSQAAEREWKIKKEKIGVVGSAAKFVMENPTPENLTMGLKTLVDNGVMSAEQANQYLQQGTQNPALIRPQAEMLFRSAVEADKQLASFVTRNTGGTTDTLRQDPVTGQVATANVVKNTMTPGDIQQAKDAQAGRAVQWAKLAEDKRQFDATQANKAKDDADPGKYTQVIIDPDKGPILIDRKDGTWKPVTGAGGSSIEGKNVTSAKRLESQLKVGIEEARKLIPIATGSGVGRGIDWATSMVGVQTEGDNAATQLETLAGWMTSNVPRMQGPQSDKDTLLYKQMAAQVGDRTKTRAARLKALETLEGLQKKYSEMRPDQDAVPTGVDPEDWKYMTPEQRKLWKKP